MSTRAHGTRNRYVHGPDEHDQPGPCRCTPCRAANAEAQAQYHRVTAQRAWGAAPPAYVDAAPARAHLKMLAKHGIGWKRAAALSGVANGAVSRLLYGLGEQPPSARIRPETEAKILAVQPSLDVLSAKTPVDATGTRRRVQALVALGWSLSELARRIGWIPTNMPTLAHPATTTVQAATARLVRDLYNQLSMHPAPVGGSATRARRMAETKGWLPPLAWDDDLIDLPDADLKTEVERRAADMDDEESSRCWSARYKQGDLSPLIAAGAREHVRRLKQGQAAS
ncbi:hypothetical protein GCM10009555_018090 [Acrocarpospora macrocephala]|uniref:Uncharacterized protein n=1 Tax=Acrocarpospora macrocephala TaxID=150177 RepID=A0A5M3WGV3_9ACTN|nr:hypothetical protein [Acrocarpospora macrocephala]GES07469.1 hypothetical protein Amac_010640 [Acrocarpospora macrocephala]